MLNDTNADPEPIFRPDQRSALAGIVLCGGKSSRMGQSKAELPFGDETTLQRIVRLVQLETDSVIVVGSPQQPDPGLGTNVSFVRDEVPFSGPLSGLITGLSNLQVQIDAAFLIGCDTPLLQPRVISFLAEALTPEVDMTVIDDGTRLQPLTAIYHRTVLPTARLLFSQGERSLQTLLRRSRLRKVDLHEVRNLDPDLLSLKSMNTEQEYKSLLHLLRNAAGS